MGLEIGEDGQKLRLNAQAPKPKVAKNVDPNRERKLADAKTRAFEVLKNMRPVRRRWYHFS